MADNDDLVYKANLNIEDILSGLKKVDKSTEDTAKRIDAHFKKAGKSISGLFIDANGRIRESNGRFSSMGNAAAQGFKRAEGGAKNLGVQIGFTAGLVSSITTKFIELGHRMVAALSQGVKESVTLASNLETTEAIFTGIFQGNEDAAVGALARIRKESRELGVDLSETARAFLPFVENLDQLSKIGKISAALALSQPEQGELGARIALQEFLSGSAQSLVRRFEIPKNLGKELNEALATGGIEKGIEKLDDILVRMGRSIDQIGDTAQLSFGKADIARQQLQTAFGQPILDELKAQFDDLNVIVAENFDDYTLIADTFGRILAHIVEIVGSGLTDFLAGLDTEQVIEIGETLFDIVENARLFADILSDTDVPTALLDGIQSVAEGLETALDTAIKLAGIVKAQAAQEAGKAKALEDLGLPARSAGVPTELLLSEDQKAKVEAAGEKAFRDSILETSKAIEESTKRKEENRQATDDLAASQKESTQAGEDEADAFLAQAQAARELAEAAEAVADAQAKIDEAMEKAALDNTRKLEDIEIAHGRKLLDIQIEFANKRVDAARDNLQKIADLRRKNAQDVEDAATDLSRDEEDIARKFSDERIDLEREQRQSRLDIETSFREKLQDIQKESAFDLEEAERNRDAISFIRILREQQKQVSTAQTDRQRELDELRVQGERKKEELAIQRQRDIEEAHIANERKLEDLRLNLERQIEAQNTAYAQQLEDLTIGEQRKNEEAQRARDRDIEDAKLAYDRKLSDLREALAAELALIEEFADKKAKAESSAKSFKKPSKTGGKGAGFGSNPGTITGKQFGGLVNRGQAVPVGERGPELFVPSANGRIIPSNQLLLPSFTPKTAISNITNSQQSNVNLGVLDPDSVGVLNESRMKNIVLSILAGL